MWRGIIFLLLCLFAPCSWAQQGDKVGETQTNVVPNELIPLAPALSPADELKTFKLQPGFHIELVAAEPLARDPIQIAFDPDGRLWVLEMRGYMLDVDGHGETNGVGDLVVLEDLDGDGRMDRRTVFLDGLVMPRSFALVRGGVLIAEPPMLWFCRDTNGDGRSDEKIEVAHDYATQADPRLGLRANPEHASNGLLPAMDNWIYSANHTTRFRSLDDDSWQREPTIFRGQWGISQDNRGRLFYNSNEDPLRADLVPSGYLGRNPNYRKPVGANVQLYEDKTVWPVRVNPGVNRGYRKGQLRPDGTLATFTAACAPLVYRGDNFPADCVGDVFVCEPAGNLIRRFAISERGIELRARNAYDKSEFLASTDERFRPVNLAVGPDGGLYVVDMYHGIIQHRNYVTSYLRHQILDRGLEQPTGLGRIYRIAADNTAHRPKPNLAGAGFQDLVDALSHRNGWWRDTAQRLLVERNETGAVSLLKRLAVSGPEPLGRLHALWTLEGMRQLDAPTLQAAVDDQDSNVRAAAIRLGEPLLGKNPELLSALFRLVPVADPAVQLQLALTLGQLRNTAGDAALASILSRNATNAYLRDAVLTGLGGRELEFLTRLLADPVWRRSRAGYSDALGRLATCVVAEGKSNRVARLLQLAADGADDTLWQRTAMLDGMINATARASRIKKVRFDAEPAALAVLRGSEDLRDRAARISDLITWPGKPGEVEEIITPLSSEQQKRFEAGKELFGASCAACHQPHGLGQEGLAPPLADSEWVLGPPQRLARIALHGVRGRITVEGQNYELDMPSFGVFDDDQLAAILTYIRREWGHHADPVDPQLVKNIRAETSRRDEAWSEEELLKIH